MVEPTFLGIGAMKAGTSTVHQYLSLHPEVFVPEIKEIHWFHRETMERMSHEEYENHFPNEYKVRGEISPSYDQLIPKIYSYYHNIKIIYIVRNPMIRFRSALKMIRHNNFQEGEPNPLYFDLDRMIEENDYHIRQGCYKDVILKTELYGLPIHIINFDDIVQNQQKVWDGLCDFLEVSRFVPFCSHCNHSPWYLHSNPSHVPDQIITYEQEEYLRNYYQPSVDFLQNCYDITMEL